jgi:hypothetical protein
VPGVRWRGDGAGVRHSRTFQVGEIRVTVEEAAPRVAFKVIARVSTMLGPALSGLIANTGIEVTPGVVVSWHEIVQGGGAVRVLNALLKRLGEIDPDEVSQLLDDLTVGTTLHVPGAQAPILVTKPEVLDAYMPSGFAMIGLLRFALEVNLRPIWPAAATSDTSSAGRTSTSPAATP